MITKRFMVACCCALIIGLGGCSRQQSDWQKTRERNTPEAYEQFLKKYPSGEFTPQAQARLKELYDDRDWQKARDADTPEAYQAYLNQYPEGQSATEARNRLENFTMAQPPAGTPAAPGTAPEAPAGTAGPAGGDEETPPARPPATAKGAAPAPAPRKVPPAQPMDSLVSPLNHHSPVPADKQAEGSYAVQLGAFRSGNAAANK